ncbi:M15 family metallopeptidase [Peribacillus sp. SCS-155]|uniref:M15 family metallopeptidase n=1 Tax=Peribacillus sedimenti TaxID=3115297 RepID=UPI003905971F
MEELRRILMSHPLIEKIGTKYSDEPFVDLNGYDPEISVDPALAGRTPFFSFVRLSVAEKLFLAKQFLPKDIRFLVKEGYRPLHIQEQAFERSLQRVKQHNSNQGMDFLVAESSKYVAPPQVAPHPTGGAIDVTLMGADGKELDLGTDFDALPHEVDYATFFDAANISEEARYNRYILRDALQAVGFTNYFTEWWHWSYGDRYWAVMNGHPEALYNPVSEEELQGLVKVKLIEQKSHQPIYMGQNQG